MFAKASVKLVSGKLSHENDGNQLVQPAAIFTFILLAVAAVSQIVALNKGLRAYDSTLVVPMFYGVYTASGFLNSLVRPAPVFGTVAEREDADIQRRGRRVQAVDACARLPLHRGPHRRYVVLRGRGGSTVADADG